MSPFEAVADRLAGCVATLAVPAQVLFFACASEALSPAFARWNARVTGSEPPATVLEQANGAAAAWATGHEGVDLDGPLEALQRAQPVLPTDFEGFTAAQDAWICGDVALRVARGEFEARDGIWYVLEPAFHATSERLFGVYDVGSERADVDEATALRDPSLAAAVAAVESALDHLQGVAEPTERDARQVRDALAKLTF
jgi:hypothetical protein